VDMHHLFAIWAHSYPSVISVRQRI